MGVEIFINLDTLQRTEGFNSHAKSVEILKSLVPTVFSDFVVKRGILFDQSKNGLRIGSNDFLRRVHCLIKARSTRLGWPLLTPHCPPN